MTYSAHEKITGVRHKPVPQYIAETRDGFIKMLPFGTNLRQARKLAQDLANEKDSTIHLLVRSGYGPNATKYVPGRSLYHPSDFTFCPDCKQKNVYVRRSVHGDSYQCRKCQWGTYLEPSDDCDRKQLAAYHTAQQGRYK